MQPDVAFHPAQISLKCIGASASGGFHEVFELFGMVHCQPVRWWYPRFASHLNADRLLEKMVLPGFTYGWIIWMLGNQHVGCLVINHLDVTKFLVCIIEMKIHCWYSCRRSHSSAHLVPKRVISTLDQFLTAQFPLGHWVLAYITDVHFTFHWHFGMAVHQQYLTYSTWGRPIVSLASSKKDPILIDFVDRHLEQWNLNPSTPDLSLRFCVGNFSGYNIDCVRSNCYQV